jgi:serine protease Do
MNRSRCDRLARRATVVALLSLAPGLAWAQQPTSTPDAAKTSAAIAQLQSLSDAFATVAERVRPSVVYITARQSRTLAQRSQRGAPSIPGLPPELRRFFEMPGMPDGGAPPRSGRASGSGFVVSADGYVLTNAHVIDSSTQVTVRLLDRREFPARIVGTDPTTDVAVLKIEATGLTPAPLGDSDNARVGEWVLAIGNPLGENLTFTVTQGIISAKGRSLALPNRSQSSIQDFIQTDAAINPGNSGGPLINVRGEVIGINGAIASPTGFSAGYGFAVPINLARAVMSQIRTNGRVERAALGVLVRDANTDDAAYVGLSDNRGVVVQDFASLDSPARRAGLLPGDVIISVDKRRVDYVAQLQEAIAFRKPGETVEVEVARKGGQRTAFRVPLQRSSPVEAAIAPQTPRPAPSSERSESTVPALGITVAPIDATTTRGMEVPEEVRGVIVTDVDDSSPAAGRIATPQTGGPDVILSIEGVSVTTPEAVKAALRSVKPGEIVSLRIYNMPAKTRRIERVRVSASAER